ncbi:transmembrane protein [Besnoitia besnoiti]|uniref:Transmembrane protein n=1 Tax=Besnoitia besnoiti TaxID=94643 RepID=A0A2A9MMU9_BESBE|nr:transmembrane protein [Besnoitia besnoiti]PFH38714.1 transmembrane protein [Besnoitia besnoiti]
MCWGSFTRNSDPMELQQLRTGGHRGDRPHAQAAPGHRLLPDSSTWSAFNTNTEGDCSYHQSQGAAMADRHPYCVVWTYLPCLTTFFPFIGHVGICTAEGVVHDFAGPYFVSVDRMQFHRPMRAWRLERERMHPPVDAAAYDMAIQAADTRFRETSHNLFCNNCHHHVAEALNRMAYDGRRDWTQFDVWWQLLIHGRFLTWRDWFLVWAPWILLVMVVLVSTTALPWLKRS